ncbi:hypothetical protein C8J57DRAFT_1273532 [Mycena rebaudengoi]|nr:hypothetical protein C8J57DRAFT_1273532 [Mycena rebaudengoi]
MALCSVDSLVLRAHRAVLHAEDTYSLLVSSFLLNLGFYIGSIRFPDFSSGLPSLSFYAPLTVSSPCRSPRSILIIIVQLPPTVSEYRIYVPTPVPPGFALSMSRPSSGSSSTSASSTTASTASSVSGTSPNLPNPTSASSPPGETAPETNPADSHDPTTTPKHTRVPARAYLRAVRDALPSRPHPPGALGGYD